ncbi:MAG TPA: SMI1/KNR4 family protein [Acidimicrobiales bacterium]|nr:SMI1/KNR4 family protein [Acidimicrobiales bacterium]
MTFQEVSRSLREHPLVEHGTGATADEIARAERDLAVTFPTNYRLYLREFGWIEIGSAELFGLGHDVPFHLDLVRITVSERTEMHPLTPHNLIPLLNDGGGNLACLDTSRSEQGDCPVVFQDHELDEIRDVCGSFLAWLVEEMALHTP